MADERHPLDDLFEDQIKDLYSAENQIIKALPKMAKNSTSPQLRTAFEKHLEETAATSRVSSRSPTSSTSRRRARSARAPRA